MGAGLELITDDTVYLVYLLICEAPVTILSNRNLLTTNNLPLFYLPYQIFATKKNVGRVRVNKLSKPGAIGGGTKYLEIRALYNSTNRKNMTQAVS
jgi:hypothetical protein